MHHIHVWYSQACIKHVYTWRESDSYSFFLHFSLSVSHTHTVEDWNPIITKQRSPLTTGWPQSDHVMEWSLGPSTEKHFPTLQIRGQFYSFPTGHWGYEGVIKLIHRLHLREISFQSCAVIQYVACLFMACPGAWVYFCFISLIHADFWFYNTCRDTKLLCCLDVGLWNYNLVCIFSLYPGTGS